MIRLGCIRFDWQIGLIGLSALVGLLIAYNRQLAALQFAIIVIAIGVYLAFANMADPLTVHGQSRPVLSILIAGLPTMMVAISLFTINWSRWIDKIPALDQLLREMAAWLPGVEGPGLNPNVIGGALAALLPLQIFALRRVRRSVSALLIALTLIALLLSQSRGAWLSLLIVFGMWLMWTIITKRVSDEKRARRLWIAAVTSCAVTLIALLFVTPIGDRLIDLGGDRRAIWHNSIDLISDYPFTGPGLASFEMAYSTYVLLIHVGHTMHAHNLWLDMWLNQGVLGVIALAGLIVNAVWPKPSSAWRMPALLTLGVILLHSIGDDPYYGYGSAALPVVFIPLGLLARSGPVNSVRFAAGRSKIQPAFAVWIGAAVVFFIDLLTPMGHAAIEANLGALAQTRAELSAYDWPVVPIQDALRQSGMVDLTSAMQHYQSALALDPANVTANRRLGQIELARGLFDAACQHFSAALAANPQQRATRQLAGECLALDGKNEEAIALWRSVDLSEGQLANRLYWYDEYLLDHKRGAQLALLGAQLNQ